MNLQICKGVCNFLTLLDIKYLIYIFTGKLKVKLWFKSATAHIIDISKYLKKYDN